MVDRYWRKIEDVENDIENAMQISSILLKLKGYDKKLEGLSKIDTNEENVASNLTKINDNENSISNNLDKIDNISQFILKSDKDFKKTYNIESQRFEFDKNNHFFNILEKEIEHDFIKNSLLFVKNNIYYKYDDLSDDYYRCQHEYTIYDNENNLINKYLFNKDTYYDENSSILNTTEEFCIYFKNNYNKIKIVLELHRHNRHGFGNINLEIDDNYENYIKLDYIEKGFLDNSHLINTNTSDISNNLGKINTNTSDISDNLGKINTNTSSISSNLGKINTNTSSISSNLGKINTNTSDITSNLSKIGANTTDITNNLSKIKNITKSIMLKNTYFTDFDSTDELKRKELLRFDNNSTNIIRGLYAVIHYKALEYNFKKDDFLEVEYKLILNHSTYDHAKNIILIYELYQEADESTNTEYKTLCKKVYRYNQFNEMIHNKRISAYTKLCYKVKYDITKILIRVYIEALPLVKKTHLVVHHDVVKNGANYIFAKHYGK